MAWPSLEEGERARADRPWPRTYRARRGLRTLFGGLGALFAVGGIALLAWATGRAPGEDRAPMLAVGLLAAALGGLLVVSMRGLRVILWEDAIEFVELGRHKRFRRSDLSGWRLRPLQYGLRALVLEFRTGRAPFKTGMFFEADEAFVAWFAGLPDLDAEERARRQVDLLRSPELGASEAERVTSLGRARVVARAATVVAVAACAWGFLRPQPYGLAMGVLAAIPVVAACILLLGRGAFAVGGERNDPRPDLGVALAGPGIVLMVRAVLDLTVIDWQPPLLCAVVGAPVAVLLVLRAAEPGAHRRWFVVPLVSLLAAPWFWGSLTLGNAVLDRARGESFEARVLDKRIERGKVTRHLLKLAPWGPVIEEDEVDAGREAYEQVEIGDVVCPRLRPGALGFRWFRLERCDRR